MQVYLLECIQGNQGFVWDFDCLSDDTVIIPVILADIQVLLNSKEWLEPQIHLVPEGAVCNRVYTKSVSIAPADNAVSVPHIEALVFLNVALTLT